MNQTLVSEDHEPFRRLLRPVVRVLRKAYIQGTTVVKLLPTEKSIQLYYRIRKKSYDFQWSLDPGYRKGLRRLIEMAVAANDRVIDVGCGTGSATVLAAANACEVIGIDLSEDMIELAEEKIRKECLNNIKFVTTSVEDYRPEKLFDKVISSFMIPHVKPHLRPAIYSCMYHFLKPGGTVGLFGSRGEVCDVYETRSEIEENLARSGFKQIEVQDVYDIYRIVTAVRPLDS